MSNKTNIHKRVEELESEIALLRMWIKRTSRGKKFLGNLDDLVSRLTSYHGKK